MGIFLRGKIWYVRYRSPVTGEVVRKSTGTSNKRLAVVIAQDTEVRIAKQKFLGIVVPEKLLFENLCARFLKFMDKRRRPQTIRRNQTSINNLKRYFSGKLISDISPRDIEHFVTMRLKQGVARRTVNIDLTCLHFMLKKAVAWNFLVKNPSSGIKKLKEEPRPIEILTAVQEKRLLEECPAHVRPIVKFILHTGLRKGEVLDLRWSDIILPNRCIRVRGTKVHKMRYVRINDTLLQLITELGPKDGRQYVFADKNGQRYGDIKKGFKAACRRAGIPSFRFHDLRHSFASRLIMAGGSLKALQIILGHTDIRVTERYSHLSETYLLDEMKKLDQSTNKAHLASAKISELAKC